MILFQRTRAAMKPDWWPSYEHFRPVVWFWIPIIVCCFGIPLNTLSIVVLCIDVSFKRTARFLLQMLAVTDNLYLATWACEIFAYRYNTEWYLKFIAYIYLTTVAWVASIWMVVIVTGERYVVITRPLHADQNVTMTRARRAVICVWIGSAILVAPLVIVENLLFGFTTTLSDGRVFFHVVYNQICSIIVVLIPLAILIFFNYRLIRAVRRHAVYIREYATQMSTIREMEQASNDQTMDPAR